MQLNRNGKGSFLNIEFVSNVTLSAYGKDSALNYVNTTKKENRILYVNKKRSQNKNTTGVQFPNNILNSDYSKNLSDFKTIVKAEFAGTIFENSGLPKFSFRAVQDTDNLVLAERMESEGVDSETIRKETGLFRSYDGMWRVEMDDSAMKIADEVSNYMKLNELIDYPELFAAYPDMKDMTVVFHNLIGKNGSYSYVFDEIDLDYSIKTDREKLKSSLLYEIQHAIQHREGFARGANVRYWEGQLQDDFEAVRKCCNQSTGTYIFCQCYGYWEEC